MQVTSATTREPTADERKRLHRIGDEPVLAQLTLAGGSTVDIAVRAEVEATLLGPFAGPEHRRDGASTPAAARPHP